MVLKFTVDQHRVLQMAITTMMQNLLFWSVVWVTWQANCSIFSPQICQLGALWNHPSCNLKKEKFSSGKLLPLETPKEEKVSFSVSAVPLDCNFRVILKSLVTDGQQQLRSFWTQPLSLQPTFVFPREGRGMWREVRKVELPLSREIPKELAVSDTSRAAVLTRKTLRALWLWPPSDPGWQLLWGRFFFLFSHKNMEVKIPNWVPPI